MAKSARMDAVQAVEISTRENGRSIHMTTFSHHFSDRVDQMLDGVNAGRREKVSKQLAQLSALGFDVGGFQIYWESKNMNLSNVGNGHIAKHLFPDESEFAEKRAYNTGVYQRITGKKEFIFRDFITNHLKDTGSHPFGSARVGEYEPTLERAAEILAPDHTIRSIAHSHLNYEDLGPEKFSQHVISLVQKNLINALEIHASAPPEWVQTYLKISKRLGILLTFGSDCHFEGKGTPSHAWLGSLNPHVEESILVREYQRFRAHLDK